MTVPKMLNDTDTDTLFPVPNIFDTDTGTFFGTNFFRYRFQDFFPVSFFSDTNKKMKNSLYREFPVTVRHYTRGHYTRGAKNPVLDL